MKRKEIAPPAVPNLRGEGDQTNFDIINADSKFNMFGSCDGEDVEMARISLGKTENKGDKRDARKAPSLSSTPLPDLNVFCEWPTTVYI